MKQMSTESLWRIEIPVCRYLNIACQVRPKGSVPALKSRKFSIRYFIERRTGRKIQFPSTSNIPAHDAADFGLKLPVRPYLGGYVEDYGEIFRGFQAQAHLRFAGFASKRLEFLRPDRCRCGHENLDADQAGQRHARYVERDDLLDRNFCWIAFFGKRGAADQHRLIFNQQRREAS